MEKIAKERVKAYRSNKAEILELDYTLQNRWKSDTMIGNDVIFDYSRGYPMPQCVVGFNQDKYERLQDRDLKRKKALEQECKEVEQFVDAITDSLAHRIFRKLFIDGRKPVTQEQVAKSVHLDRSSISKIVDRYLKDSHNSQNAQL